jgi:MoaA/NifB/PqqE/SkfB family radical SAM enzyme
MDPSAETSHRTKGLLRLTMACNERCPFCNVPAEDYRPATPPQATIDADLDAFVASGERTLTISGGEPTLLRRRLLDLVAAARARGVPLVELQTNAVLLDPDYAGALADAGLTSAFVSLLSDQAPLHDHLAGLDGAFERCLAGIDALLDAGVRVTLNPVVARTTHDRVAAYVRFVADRLPRVRSISLSAVQPHGRAGRGQAAEALLPDYAVLAEQVPQAQAAAAVAGIELLNPYCGLPLCVGWADDPDRSVEAIEAEGGGWRPLPGIENQGDKAHGAPCRRCAWRTRCGGAWRAYWSLRGGAGIAPPATLALPWDGPPGPAQATIAAPGGPVASTWPALRAARAPTVLLHTDRLARGDALRLLQSGCTDLAVTLDPAGLLRPDHAARAATARTLQQVRRLVGAMAAAPPARALRCWVRVEPQHATADEAAAAREWAAGLGLPDA